MALAAPRRVLQQGAAAVRWMRQNSRAVPQRSAPAPLPVVCMHVQVLQNCVQVGVRLLLRVQAVAGGAGEEGKLSSEGVQDRPWH